jgi:hypothetical protein
MSTTTRDNKQRISMLKVLNPFHIWALGVGIVLVGEFMGWNFSVAKGGAYGSLIACWVIALPVAWRSRMPASFYCNQWPGREIARLV